jgi:AraC-like DNA-binding protein
MNVFDQSVGTPVLQPAYIRLLCEVLLKKGLDIEPALRSAHIGDWKSLQSREAPLSVLQVSKLIEAARNAGFDDRLSLEVGVLFQVSAHGPLGYAVMASPNLNAALKVIAQYGAIRSAATRFVFRSGPCRGILEIQERVDLGLTRTFILTILALTIAHVAAAVQAGDSAIQEASFPFACPTWSSALESAMRCRCRFDAEYLRLQWADEELRKPNPTSDAQAFGDALRSCEQQLNAQRPTSLTQMVRDYLLANESAWPELGEVAAQFRVSARTLIRRLKAEGCSFQILRDELRSKRAHWYLTETEMSVEEIAHRLGYKDTSNFSRSFRRWFQTTPGKIRSERALS